MCGRFTSTAEAASITERFGVDVPEDYRRRFNVAPAQTVLSLVGDATTGERRAEPMRWGLVPHWAKSLTTGFTMINARAETLLEKPTYRSLVASRRCLVPADGFYEWRVGADGKKEPVWFSLADGGLFAFAGLWTRWIDKGTGEVVDSCTIVTTRANELVGPVHDRMPVIVAREGEDTWLDTRVLPGTVLPLLAPYPAERMRAVRASRRVNSAANDDPELLVADALAA